MRPLTRILVLSLLIGCDCRTDAVYPDKPVGMAVAALRDPTFSWKTEEATHLRVHYQPGSYVAGHLKRILADTHLARAHAIELAGAKGFTPSIDVFYVGSRAEVKRITDNPVRGWSDPAARTVVVMRTNASNQIARHEIMHVVSHNLWGYSHDALTTGWISEGVATWAGGDCSGYPIDLIAAYLDKRSELIPLDSLAKNFRSFNDLVAYLQTGSFIAYLHRAYGLGTLRRLWEQGFEAFDKAVGRAPAKVDAEWRQHLREVYPNPQVDWVRLNKEGCE